MAWDDELDWDQPLVDLYEGTFQDVELLSDGFVQSLFELGYIDHNVDHDTRMDARDALDTYLDEVYDIDFDDVFDWDQWREYMGYE